MCTYYYILLHMNIGWGGTNGTKVKAEANTSFRAYRKFWVQSPTE